MLFALFTEGGLNLSSSQSQPHSPDNRTLKSFLEAYVDKYMGGYAMEYQTTVPFAFSVEQFCNIQDF